MVAVSGTLHPASAEYGIAPDLIRATPDQLSLPSFANFCGRAGLKRNPPALDIEAAWAELDAVTQHGLARDRGLDRIWIPDRDHIIPSAAQDAAWASQQEKVRPISGPQVPFKPEQSWAEWPA